MTASRVDHMPIDNRNAPSLTAPSRKSVLVILAAILLIASGLRLYRLEEGLWWDEIFMYVNYVKMPLATFLTTYESENQHFLYVLLARASVWLFGESVWALRLPAVLFGVGSIWALYLFGRHVSSEREALLATALVAFSYHHIWFSQNARGYIGLLFWAILGSWLFLRALGETKTKWWILYATAAALGVYTHLMTLVVIIGHFVIYVMSPTASTRGMSRKRWDGLFFGFSLAGLLILLLYALILPQILRYMLGGNRPATIWKDPLWTLSEFVRGTAMGFSGSIGAVIALLVFGAGLWSFARTKPVVLQLLIIPALIAAGVAIGVGHPLWPRFFIFTMGFGALVVVRGTMLLGSGLTKLLNLAPTKAIAVGTAVCTGLVAVSALSSPSAYGPKQDYRGALAFVESNKEPGDTVVTVGAAFFPYTTLYKVDWESVTTLEALNAIRARAKRTWLIYTLPPDLEARSPAIMASVRHDFKVVKEFPGTLGGGTVFVCRSDTPPRSAGGAPA